MVTSQSRISFMHDRFSLPPKGLEAIMCVMDVSVQLTLEPFSLTFPPVFVCFLLFLEYNIWFIVCSLALSDGVVLAQEVESLQFDN